MCLDVCGENLEKVRGVRLFSRLDGVGVLSSKYHRYTVPRWESSEMREDGRCLARLVAGDYYTKSGRSSPPVVSRLLLFSQSLFIILILIPPPLPPPIPPFFSVFDFNSIYSILIVYLRTIKNKDNKDLPTVADRKQKKKEKRMESRTCRFTFHAFCGVYLFSYYFFFFKPYQQ